MREYVYLCFELEKKKHNFDKGLIIWYRKLSIFRYYFCIKYGVDLNGVQEETHLISQAEVRADLLNLTKIDLRSYCLKLIYNRNFLGRKTVYNCVWLLHTFILKISKNFQLEKKEVNLGTFANKGTFVKKDLWLVELDWLKKSKSGFSVFQSENLRLGRIFSIRH